MIKDFNIVKGASSHYKLINTHLGRKLARPYWYWAVSIEGSPYVGIKGIVSDAKVLELYREREENNAKTQKRKSCKT